jgi:hypothetical protein
MELGTNLSLVIQRYEIAADNYFSYEIAADNYFSYKLLAKKEKLEFINSN